MKKVKYFSLIMILMLMLTGCGSSEKVALANVVHPSYAGGGYIYNEVENYDKVSVSGIKLKYKENKVNNNKTRTGDVEFEFTIKNTTNETIDNIGYMIFLKDLDGRPFAIRGKETFSLKAGEKTKIKVDHIWSNDEIKTSTNLLLIEEYNYDYPILNVYQLVDTNDDLTINTNDL